MEQIGEQLANRFGPLSDDELGALWKVMLGEIGVSGSIGLYEVQAYVAEMRRLNKAHEAELAQAGADGDGQV